MTITVSADGRRAVAVHIDVPGSQQEVWQAISTGPGISSWFVPTEIDSVDGIPSTIRMRFGPGMEAQAPVTAWEPPHRLVAEGESWGNGAPRVSNDWRVEALDNGLCRVTIINSLAADSDQWDGMLSSVAQGWPGFFRTLRLYLTHFRGQPAALVQLVRPVAGTEAQGWQTLTTALGIAGLASGQHWHAPPGAPALAGQLEYVSSEPNDILLRLSPPTPGALALGSYSYGDQAMVALNCYFYGDGAQQLAGENSAVFEEWLGRKFPSAAAQAK